MPHPRTIATTSAVGTLVAAATAGFLVGESKLARRLIGISDERPPSPDGVYGDDLPGETVRVLMLGDSTVVGYGMTSALTTPPALLGYGLSHLIGSPVDVRSVAMVGAESPDLAEQVARGLEHRPDVAVICIGANDVTHMVPLRTSVEALQDAIAALHAADVAVVLGTCPDLGTVRPIKQPLRGLARLASRRLARHQTVAAVEAGARTISMGGLLGPVFEEHHQLFFGEDRFHPSASGYASMVTVLLPAVADAVHERRREPLEEAPPAEVMPVEEAAAQASQRAGTEVTRAGRWAGVLRRLR